MLSVLPQNSFLKELYTLQAIWDSPSLIEFIQMKPTKGVFKKVLNKARDRAHNTLLYRHLPSHWKFAALTKQIIPSRMYNPHDQRLQMYRAKHLFLPINSICPLCDLNTPNTTLHKLMSCPNILRAASRREFWDLIYITNPSGYSFLHSLPQLQQFYILLGLMEVNNENVQTSINEAAEHILSII
jgi:hypothetical protein